jgi:hypothetical protein
MPEHDSAEVLRLQQDLNFFSEHFLKGLTPLREDGEWGRLTHRRSRIGKFQLGYDDLSDDWAPQQQRRLRHPKDADLASADAIARGERRRSEQRESWERNQQAATQSAGVTTFDGRPCAKWLVPYLQWAREEAGWRGMLESGWRDPEYSEHLCFQMCGAPRCPGRCAGRSSNHVGDAPPRGAIDVTEYARFGAVIRNCPLTPKIFNALPSDLVHFSASGN